MLAATFLAAIAVHTSIVTGAVVNRSPTSDLSLGGLGLLDNRAAASSCGTSGAVSCHITTVQSDTCCFESPGVSVTFLACVPSPLPMIERSLGNEMNQ